MAEITRLDKKARPATAYCLQELLFKYEHRLKEHVFIKSYHVNINQ